LADHLDAASSALATVAATLALRFEAGGAGDAADIVVGGLLGGADFDDDVAVGVIVFGPVGVFRARSLAAAAPTASDFGAVAGVGLFTGLGGGLLVFAVFIAVVVGGSLAALPAATAAASTAAAAAAALFGALIVEVVVEIVVG